MAAALTRGPAPPAKSGSRLAHLGQLPRQMARRFSWGLGDQAVSSLTNSAISIYIARELGAANFGAFSLAYVTYAFVLNASRGLATDPLVVRFSATDTKVWRRAVVSRSSDRYSPAARREDRPRLRCHPPEGWDQR